MKREQLSIIAAGVVAMLAMAAHDNWISSFVSWVAKKPNTQNTSTGNQQQAVNPTTPAAGSSQQNSIRPSPN